MPSLVFVELIRNNITDWEEAFLSMRCQLERSFDKYNPLIVGFFRNLNVDRLNLIRDTIEQIISSPLISHFEFFNSINRSKK